MPGLEDFDPAGLDQASCEICVVDQEKEPVSTARILVLNADSVLAQSETDAGGLAEVLISDARSRVLVVTADGYATHTSTLPTDLPDKLSIILRPKAQIYGVVLNANQTPVREGIRVIGTAGFSIPQPRDFLRAVDGIPVHATALTNHAGEFVLTGLQAGLSYRLFAGGSGLLSDTNGVYVRCLAEQQACTIIVHRVYGLGVEFQDLLGNPVVANPDLSGTWHGSPVPQELGVSEIPFANWMIMLAMGSRVNPGDAANLRVFLYEAKDYAFDRLELLYDGEVLGYEPFRLQLYALPLDGSLPRFTAVLDPTGAGFGSVDLRFDAWSIEDFNPGYSGDLELIRIRDRKRIISRVEIGEDLHHLISAVPSGEYEATFAMPANTLSARIAGRSLPPLRIASGEELVVQVPRGDAGSVRLIVRNPDGALYDGPVVALCVGANGQFGVSGSFSRPPYLFRYVKAGSHRINLLSPLNLAQALGGLERVPLVEVRARQRSRVELLLPSNR